MSTFYWFALVVGAGLLSLSLFGDFFGDADGLDADAGVDVDVDGDASEGAADSFKILSTRNLTYFLFGFGATGVLLGWVWDDGLATALVAGLVGVLAGTISATAFGWLGRTEAGALMDDAGWAGRTGQVTVPFVVGGTGKILVERSGRSHELLARPFDESPAEPQNWRSVMIVEMDDGIALVAPEADALRADAPPRITPKTES